jgi:hypothetical protein
MQGGLHTEIDMIAWVGLKTEGSKSLSLHIFCQLCTYALKGKSSRYYPIYSAKLVPVHRQWTAGRMYTKR